MESNSTNLETDFMKSSSIPVIIVGVAYSILCCFGIIGNSLVVFVVIRVKSMQTVTNYFICNLAISDILMSLIATTVTPIAFYMDGWRLPNFMCRLLPLTMGVSVYVSTLTSTAIGLERYLALVHPFIRRSSPKISIAINAAVWVISIFCSSPLALSRRVTDHDTVKGTTLEVEECQETWTENSTLRRGFSLFSLLLQFVIPSLVIGFCYYKISTVLMRRFQRRAGFSQRQREAKELLIKRRTNSMLIAMVTIFVVCWVPLNLFLILTEFFHIFPDSSRYSSLVFFVCHFIAMSSAVYNPFLYAWMNETFRKELLQLLFKMCNIRFFQGRQKVACGRPTTTEFSSSPTPFTGGFTGKCQTNIKLNEIVVKVDDPHMIAMEPLLSASGKQDTPTLSKSVEIQGTV